MSDGWQHVHFHYVSMLSNNLCIVVQWVYSKFSIRVMLCPRETPWALAELNKIDFDKIKETMLLRYIQ
jgi:hypothetical protein